MGNVPLCVPKKNSIEFGDYMDLARGRFSLRAFHPYEASTEDLRPIMEAATKESEGGDFATIMGLEMDEESVRMLLGEAKKLLVD